MNIDNLQKKDVEKYIEKLKDWNTDQNKYAEFEYIFNLKEVLTDLIDVLENKGLVLVAKIKDEIVGSIVFEIAKMNLCPHATGIERVWHCNSNLPSKTKYRILQNLLCKADKWAKENNLKRLIVISSTKNPIVKLIKKNKYVETETYFEKEIKYGK